MGLDASLYVNGEERKYWRKFGELHNLITELWENDGNEGDFNCEDYVFKKEDFDLIIKCLKSGNMPGHSGFFFGGSNMGDEERIKDAIKVFKEAKEDYLHGAVVVYNSWW